MKKILLILLIVISVSGVLGFWAESDVRIDYGDSTFYSQEDMNAAIEQIKKEFRGWSGCKLHSIAYSSDDECNSENIKWMNELAEANDMSEEFEQCIMFKSDFHSPKNGGGGWNSDYEYTGWQWWLARSKNGSWKLMTYGY